MIYSEDTPTFHHSNKNEKRGDQALKKINDFWLNLDFDGAWITFDILLFFFFLFVSLNSLYYLLIQKLY